MDAADEESVLRRAAPAVDERRKKRARSEGKPSLARGVASRAIARAGEIEDLEIQGRLVDPRTYETRGGDRDRGRRRRRDDSDDSDGERGDQLFRDAPVPLGQQRISQAASRSPGALALETVSKMHAFLLHGAGAVISPAQSETLPAVLSSYLNLAYFPARRGEVNLRTAREMRTLALIGDHLLCGRLLESMDVVCQRIKALEAFEASGNWEAARWLELLPPQDVGVTPRNELRDAQKEQILEEQVRGSRAPWAARPGGNEAAGAWKG